MPCTNISTQWNIAFAATNLGGSATTDMPALDCRFLADLERA